MRTPLTDRTAASKLILATAHHAEGKLALTPSWQGAFPVESTLVLYMPGRRFDVLSADLMAAGIKPDAPCVAVSKATTPEELVSVTTVGGLPGAEIGPAPVILLIGYAIRPWLKGQD